MNKVKTIKVKNEDGSVSEESYAIAADALNIDMVNGKNVQETIGTIDVDKDGDIAAQLNKKINKSDIIDNLDSTDANKVLSAKQGKVLNEAVAAANSDIKKKIYYFNTIAEMKKSDLQVGDTCQTLGYYSINDDGAGLYKITNSTSEDDGGSIHILDNGLRAELQINRHNVVCWGAFKNQQISSSTAIKNCIEYNKGSYITFPDGIFYIDEPIKNYPSYQNFTNIILNEKTIIKPLSSIDYILDVGGIDETFSYEVGNKIFIKGGILDAKENVSISAIKIEQKIKDLELFEMQLFTNCDGIIIGDNNTSSQDLYIHHLIINHNHISNDNIGIIINSNDNSISDCRIYFNKKAIVSNGGSSFLSNVHTLANNLQNDSISFEVNSSLIIMNNCYGDSEDTFIKINGSNIHPYIMMSNCEYYSYRNNKTTMFDIKTYARLKINNLHINCKEGNEHIGIKCPFDYLDSQLSEEMLDFQGLSIEGTEYMRNGDILKGLTSAKKGKSSFLMQNDSTPMDKNEWYILGYFPIKNYIFNNINLVISNRKSNYPIYVKVFSSGNLDCDLGVSLADTVDTADYQIGYKLINNDFDTSIDYPRVACYFKETSSQNRWIQDIEIISNKIIPISTSTNRGTKALEKAIDMPYKIYSITGSSKAIQLIQN